MSGAVQPHVAVVAQRGPDVFMFVMRFVPTSLGALEPAREECRRRGLSLLWAKRAARVMTLKRRRVNMEAA